MRRFFIIFITLSLAVCFLLMPVSASTTYSYDLTYSEDEGGWVAYDVDLRPNTYTISYTLSALETVLASGTYSGDFVLVEEGDLDGIYVELYVCELSDFAIYLMGIDGVWMLNVTGDLPYFGDGTELKTTFETIDPGFGNSISSGLLAVINWAGEVVEALLSGPLSGLLQVACLAIAVSALFMGIRFIRASGWGI